MRPANFDTPRHNISTVARVLDVSVEALRLYDRKGLLLVAKNGTGQRLYSDADIDRLKCIRHAITESKISIEGIRRMHSMIPCWKLRSCSMEERSLCPAYKSPNAGCWTYAHKKNACAEIDCRSCEVYALSADCDRIKSVVHMSNLSLTPNLISESIP